jgi:prolyl oligopeptidase
MVAPFPMYPFNLLAPACLALACIVTMPVASATPPDDQDPYRWLEDVHGERALEWVRARNAVTLKELQARPDYAPTRERLLSVLNAKDRIPNVARRGDWLYNFWQDGDHQRGLWRRTTLAEYRRPEPAWETVLDVDALGTREKENWVWAGATCLGPQYRHCLVSLSRGGADAKVVREFDAVEKRFVSEGFTLPEAKSDVDWIDADSIFVSTDFGPGSLTDSGYPRIIKRWKRDTPLSSAVTVYEAKTADVSAFASVDNTPGFERVIVGRSIDFYNTEQFLLGSEDSLQKIDVPSDATPTFWREHILLTLRSDMTEGGKTYPHGSLLVMRANDFLAGKRDWQVLFTPTPTRSLSGMTETRDALLLEILDNVASKLQEWCNVDGRWVSRDVAAPFPGSLGARGLHDPLLKSDPLADDYLLSYTDFLTPDSLALARVGSDRRELLKARAALFDAQGMRVDQFFARSKDGTAVPYFVVWPKGAKADGGNPTLLYGYGGFEISQLPWYSGSFGTSWYERGGVLVVANIRGGGEFGPAWHQAAVKEHKQRSYDDFIAVAEDIIARKITSPQRLGIEGGSNGGLLVGAVMVQRPELFGAVVCQVPLLDMRRYNQLLAGASWMAEYGDPDDPQQWRSIARYSPYQNVKPGVKMPRVLFTTSTRDDRVHPGHARKMAARMLEQGHDVLYYENIEGGHGGAADNEQRATVLALEFGFLWEQLGRSRSRVGP